MFARTGVTSPLGKLDDKLREVRVESAVKEAFNRKRAALTKKPEAEVIRDFVRVAAFGREQAVRMYGEGVLVVLQMVGGMPDDS